MFKINAGHFEREGLLYAADADVYAGFGVAVALSGQTIIAGAYGDNEKGPYAGAAYIFEESNGLWS